MPSRGEHSTSRQLFDCTIEARPCPLSAAFSKPRCTSTILLARSDSYQRLFGFDTLMADDRFCALNVS
ncbi:MAG TPA: hypothetical protein VNX70_10170, partial [Bryobacteraceae bacterium]|nr:hypothetical protein [Bryobacteraceae bacterium]